MARILVAEDEKSLADLFRSVLNSMNHEVYISPNGEHALETLQNNLDFDLVISDMKMPKKNGLQLLESMHRQPELSSIPTIIVSGYLTMAEEVLLKAGAVAFLEKPIDMEKLREAIDKALGYC